MGIRLSCSLKNRANVCLFIAILIFLCYLRYQFLVAFPDAFGHPDTWQYSHATVKLYQGEAFRPDPIRLMGTYAYYLLGILKTLGTTSFTISFTQHLTGLAAALLAFLLIKGLTHSFLLANLTFLLVGSLPRGLFYEHIVLVDSLYTFLLLGFCYATFRGFRSFSWTWVLLMGIFSSGLLLSRGQGLLCLPLGVFALLIVKADKLTGFGPRLGALILFLFPCLVAGYSYVQANLKQNDFPGLSASGYYNLFWVASSNLVDFESPRNPDIKERLKSCVLASNNMYWGDSTWALYGPKCQSVVYDFTRDNNDNWRLINHRLGEMAKESILSHPIAFTHRIYWNLVEFFYAKTHLFRTADISPLLLGGDKTHFYIDREKAKKAQDSFNIRQFGWATFGIDHLESFFVKHPRRPAHQRMLNDYFNATSPLTSARLFSLFTYLFLILYLFQPTLPNRPFALWLGALLLGQIVLTVMPVNALYDRYYIAPEALQVLLLSLSLQALTQLNKAQWGQSAVFLIAFPLAVAALWWLFRNIPLPLPLTLDKAILGMPLEWVTYNQRYAIAFTATAGLIGIASGYLILQSRKFPSGKV